MFQKEIRAQSNSFRKEVHMVYGAVSPLSSPWPVPLVPPWLCELVGEGFLGKALSLRCGL